MRVDAIESQPSLSPVEVSFVNAAFRVMDSGSGRVSFVELEAMLRLEGVPPWAHRRYCRMVTAFSQAASAAIAEQHDRRSKEGARDNAAGRH